MFIVVAVAVPLKVRLLTFGLAMFVALPLIAPACEIVKAKSPSASLGAEYEIPVDVE
jgi:hypothetical protein